MIASVTEFFLAGPAIVAADNFRKTYYSFSKSEVVRMSIQIEFRVYGLGWRRRGELTTRMR